MRVASLPFSRRNGVHDAMLVAEPTRCEAVLAHRGIASVLMRFRGAAGHASGANAMAASALHQAVRWGGAHSTSWRRRRTRASVA
jgi:acetylornithine deacetylase